MTAMPSSRPTLERWLGLLVRYWAFNMTLVHDQGVDWPGFAYTGAEKAELKSISEKYPSEEYYTWVALVVFFALAIFGGVVFAGMSLLTYAIGGEQNMASTPAQLFFLALALQLLVSLSLGLPLAMLPAAALAGRFFTVADQDLPEGATIAHYFHKLWLQLVRVAILCVAVCVAMWMFVPGDSKFYLVLKLVLPMLSPAVSAFTFAYFFIRREIPKARISSSDR